MNDQVTHAESAENSGYEHFMLKEIHEQPKVIRDMINSIVKDGIANFILSISQMMK